MEKFRKTQNTRILVNFSDLNRDFFAWILLYSLERIVPLQHTTITIPETNSSPEKWDVFFQYDRFLSGPSAYCQLHSDFSLNFP